MNELLDYTGTPITALWPETILVPSVEEADFIQRAGFENIVALPNTNKKLAKKEMERYFINLPDKDLSYFVEGTDHFADYTRTVLWAQDFAMTNRKIMMEACLKSIDKILGVHVETVQHAINCHHNYVEREQHFGANVWLTRKGAIRARKGDLGIIPGSMGAKSFIVEGLGNPESLCSCSHGAGRSMSRMEARRRFTIADLASQTAGIECRKDEDVIDEIPQAYKDIDVVMANQSDLVRVKHTLKQVLNVRWVSAAGK